MPARLSGLDFVVRVFLALSSICSFFSTVHGHATLRYLWDNPDDINTSTDTCIRKGFQTGLEATVASDVWAVGYWHQGFGKPEYSVPGVSSPDLACGNNGTIAAPRLCDVRAGQTIGLEWHTNYTMLEDPREMIELPIDESHLGPVQHYLAGPLPRGSAASSKLDLKNLKWFKIEDFGYKNGEWGTEVFKKRMNLDGPPFSNNWPVKLPEELEGGEYLLRSELTALHRANQCNTPNGFQVYTRCAQLKVKEKPGRSRRGYEFSPVTKFPGAYHFREEGVWMDVYESERNPKNFTYKMIGPPVAKYRRGRAELYLAKDPGDDRKVMGCSCPKKPGEPASCY